MLNKYLVTAAAAAVISAACADQPTEPGAIPTGASFTSASSTGLVECPSSTSQSASGTLLASGGSVSVGRTTITLPIGAVLGPTRIDLTVPASNYMEVDIRANGAEHFQFQKPVTVTIDYSRCTRNDLKKVPLTAWYIDGATKALLEDMKGVDDKTARTVTFNTGHLSGYSVGYAQPGDSTGTGN